jgi:hypothetical protein
MPRYTTPFSALPLDDPARLSRLTPQQRWIAVRLQTDSVEAVAEEMCLFPETFRERHLEPIRRLLSAD